MIQFDIITYFTIFAAIEYVTVRCDSVASNRFPRNTKLLQSAWKDHNDYIYYDVNCFNNATGNYISRIFFIHKLCNSDKQEHSKCRG